jgi:4-hydroxybenzoate polyprenyltransferase
MNEKTHDHITTIDTTLYVDLDGTFIKSDMLLETFLVAFKNNPLIVFTVFFWLLQGKAYLKQKLSESATVNVASIPVNPQTFKFLEQQKSLGRKIVLATASNQSIAKQFVNNYVVFDNYIASTTDNNLKGQNKLDAILKLSKEDENKFDYMGNSIEDFILFEKATNSYLVAPTANASQKSKQGQFFTECFDETSAASLKLWIKQLRIYQWLKNGLIFVPLLVANQFTDLQAITNTLLAFVSFGLLASSTYVMNDLVDLESDRTHKRKCHRPLASCQIHILPAIIVATMLFIVSLLLAWSLSNSFLMTLVVYLTLTLSYSFKIKRYFGMDVIALASLYTIRIFAGAAVIGVTVSFWLLSFSMFIFLSLALVKRCAELVALKQQNQIQISGRDYNTDDLLVFTSFGTTSSLIAVLMYCFYMNSNVLSNQYQEPQLLWLSLPALGYWLMRMWVKTLRGEMHDDPIVFSLKDRGSMLSIMIMAIFTMAAHI